jgi:Hint module
LTSFQFCKITTWDLYFGVFALDDNSFGGTQINMLPKQPSPSNKLAKAPTCISTENELRQAVSDCGKNGSGLACTIDICQSTLHVNNSSKTSIDISNKNIILGCSCLTNRCILDGMNSSRIFYGSRTNFTAQNVIFANGFHPEDGGSIKFVDNSIVTMSNCSFVNNTAPFGSAIIVNNSKLTIEDLETSIINNTGLGPPIEILSSQLYVSNAVFVDNNAEEYNAAILSFNSTIEVYDIHILTTVTRRRRKLVNLDDNLSDCDVYIAVDAKNFTKQFSCMNFEESNKTIPVIKRRITSDICPTTLSAIPTAAPKFTTDAPTRGTSSPTVFTRAPTGTNNATRKHSHALCFSGENQVEIQYYGYIQMSQLRIGDFVKSSRDKFSQVYGFGHFDHDQEGIFLHILVAKNYHNYTAQYDESFIKISPKHLVLVEQSNKEIPIPAADIVVGDLLSGKRVIEIQTVFRRGVYAPLTQSGDIVINGILASNYVDVFDSQVPWNQHSWGHIMFTPQRVFCHHCMTICKKEIYINGYGILAYLIVLISWIINACLTSFQIFFRLF